MFLVVDVGVSCYSSFVWEMERWGFSRRPLIFGCLGCGLVWHG